MTPEVDHAEGMNKVILEAINNYLKNLHINKEIQEDWDAVSSMLLGLIGGMGKIVAMCDSKNKYQLEITKMCADTFKKFHEIRGKIREIETKH